MEEERERAYRQVIQAYEQASGGRFRITLNNRDPRFDPKSVPPPPPKQPNLLLRLVRWLRGRIS